MLHIYDSNTNSEVPVDVIRMEKVSLPALRKVDALLKQPQQKQKVYSNVQVL